jgi:hypothetical protein
MPDPKDQAPELTVAQAARLVTRPPKEEGGKPIPIKADVFPALAAMNQTPLRMFRSWRRVPRVREGEPLFSDSQETKTGEGAKVVSGLMANHVFHRHIFKKSHLTDCPAWPAKLECAPTLGA